MCSAETDKVAATVVDPEESPELFRLINEVGKLKTLIANYEARKKELDGLLREHLVNKGPVRTDAYEVEVAQATGRTSYAGKAMYELLERVYSAASVSRYKTVGKPYTILKIEKIAD